MYLYVTRVRADYQTTLSIVSLIELCRPTERVCARVRYNRSNLVNIMNAATVRQRRRSDARRVARRRPRHVRSLQ